MWGYGPHWGMMGGFGYGSYGAFSMLLGPIILIAIIVSVIWFVRKDASLGALLAPGRRSSGLDVLEERYAPRRNQPRRISGKEARHRRLTTELIWNSRWGGGFSKNSTPQSDRLHQLVRAPLFAGSGGSGKTGAVIASLVGTCKPCGVCPRG